MVMKLGGPQLTPMVRVPRDDDDDDDDDMGVVITVITLMPPT